LAPPTPVPYLPPLVKEGLHLTHEPSGIHQAGRSGGDQDDWLIRAGGADALITLRQDQGVERTALPVGQDGDGIDRAEHDEEVGGHIQV
jgi:hypothetical protein